MHHPKSLRSTCVRSAVIPAALLSVIVSACADQQATAPQPRAGEQQLQTAGPRVPRAARADNITFDKFFVAWSQSYSASPIHTQVFAIDARQHRQYAELWPDEALLSFARANPGRLYINSDEPDQWCIAPSQYADIYHEFVKTVRGADPTARVSPAGFAEPNDRCCTPGDEVCRNSMHSIGYADQFYNAYVQRYGSAPPVDEWRFHDFGISVSAGDVKGWWERVDRAAAWSVAHGANMVLGAWGFHGWRSPVSDFQEYMKQAMGLLLNDNRINGALYWSLEKWIESPRPLVNTDGSLTPEGHTYANPLTDVPTGVKLVGSANGQAKLRWANTTSAWGAEVEYWVQAPGSNSFVHARTQSVSSLGANQSPLVGFNVGDRVKARVRYYNVYGQAAWSPFSNTVSLALTEAQPDQRKVDRNRPNFCFMRSC